MNLSSSLEYENVVPTPVRALDYHDIAGHANPNMRSAANGVMKPVYETEVSDTTPQGKECGLSEAQLAEKIRAERADATRLAEERLRGEYEPRLQSAHAPIVVALREFEGQRVEYFARVEAEIVQLALAIAAKILHREAQVDSMLVATLVRIAVEKLRDGSNVTIRVGPGRAAQWKDSFTGLAGVAHVEVIEDAALSGNDCLLETELGVANFGLDTQLKEVERGFFDLLALRPGNR